MGKIFVHVNVSLDGYIERANHEIEWQFVDDEFEESPRHICRSGRVRTTGAILIPSNCQELGRESAMYMAMTRVRMVR